MASLELRSIVVHSEISMPQWHYCSLVKCRRSMMKYFQIRKEFGGWLGLLQEAIQSTLREEFQKFPNCGVAGGGSELRQLNSPFKFYALRSQWAKEIPLTICRYRCQIGWKACTNSGQMEVKSWHPYCGNLCRRFLCEWIHTYLIIFCVKFIT